MTAHLLFAAHDAAEARVLDPVVRKAALRGHRVTLLAGGPSAAWWSAVGMAFEEISNADGGGDAAWAERLARLNPDLAVTGASYHADFSRVLWRSARSRGIRTLAVLDAWINLGERWRFADRSTSCPDALCVIDDAVRCEARSEHGFIGPVHVVGQPHLEALVARLAPRRAARVPRPRPLIVVFTEPNAEYLTGIKHPGYDQFTILAAFLSSLPRGADVDIAVRTHPKEPLGALPRYRDRVGALAARCLTDLDAETLLAEADGVVGMTTMVLIEAALLGVPALSLQLGRTRMVNPVVDRMPGIDLVTDPAVLPDAVTTFLTRLGTSAPAAGGMAVGQAADRLMRAIEKELACAGAPV